jgi:hypothetical protein
MPNILIDVAAEFTGKRAFDKAGSATTKLEKNVKSLGRTLGLTFSAAAVLAYGKASVKAASADQKAQQQLAQALKNVGLGRDAATAEGYIQRIEKEFGVIDEQLRPAYSRLAIATRDTAETQRLMGIAMDISANTGKDLDAVTSALSKAYLGSNTALSKLGIGISKADLKTKSFKDITDQLAVTFAGSAKLSADSFSGSMDKLAIASNNAKEIIGTSLINALKSLGKDDSMATLSSNIESAAKSLANFTDSIVYLKDQISSIPGAGLFGYLASGVSDLLGRFSPQRLAELVKQLKGFQGMGNVSMTGGSNMDTQKADVAAKKAADAQIKAAKAAADAKIKADKLAAAKNLMLQKAASAFDLQKIQIAAALKNTYDKDDRLRLLALQEIENANGEAALKYIEQLNILTKEQQANKLNGINGITETELNSINSILMRDLEAIRISKMSEEDKAAARNEAYAKYNAAISASGGLAEAQYYTEKTQAQLLAIAKIAALDDVSNAQTTLLNIAKIDQLDVIKIVQNAQASADNEKYAALQSYINLLKSIPQIPAITQAPSIGSGGTVSNGGGMGGNYTGDFTDYLPTNPGKPVRAVSPTLNITVAGSILDGNDFTQIVNDALLNSQRTGLAQNIAGSLTVTP